MGVCTTIEIDDGNAVVRQVARPGDGPAHERLEARGRALRSAAGSGVVAVVYEGVGAEGSWELVTRYGGAPLTVGRLAGSGALARLVAEVAVILARLHAQDLSHGRLEVEHILVGSDGRPSLCGFGAAPAAGPPDDVAAVGRILGELLADLSPSTPAERRRLSVIESLAARSQAADAKMRPTARRLATDLWAAAAGGSVLVPVTTRRRPWARGGRLALAAAATGAAAGALGFAAMGVTPAADPSTGAAPPDVAARSSSTSAPDLATCVASVGHPVLPADACGTSISVEGASVVVDGHRFVVGLAGDQVIAAAWACEDGVRPAVLRPRTGEVLVYATVAAGRAPVVARAERLVGATELAGTLDDGGCAVLIVRSGAATIPLS